MGNCVECGRKLTANDSEFCELCEMNFDDDSETFQRFKKKQKLTN